MAFDSPCDADLDAMPSFDGGRRRFCSDCMRSVHMLSEMTREQAQSFMRTNPQACMSYRRGADGRLVFKPAPPSARALVPTARLTRARRSLVAAPALAALAACTAPPAVTIEVEDSVELGAEAQDYAGYRAIPHEQPCESAPPPKQAPNNEALVDGALPELGPEGHYAGGISFKATRGGFGSTSESEARDEK